VKTERRQRLTHAPLRIPLRIKLRHRRQGRLLIAAGPPRPAAWAANVWLDPQEIEIASISDAAAKLRAVQRNWAGYTPHLHRRATLIQEQLPKVSSKPLVFGAPPPAAPLGSWTLLDPGTMLASARCTSPFPHGEVLFVEDRIGPPNRAYLKLWEALTLIGCRPGPGERCLDLGSSPGGWSWALQRMGAHVVSVDKAPLAPEIARLPGIEHRLESAFALDPHTVGPVDWLFLGCRLLPGAASGAGRALARGRALPPSARSSSRARLITRPRAGSPPSRARSCATSITTSTS
jgi:23S rRNA (cytidine2498-2'-O)-methyltransferase